MGDLESVQILDGGQKFIEEMETFGARKIMILEIQGKVALSVELHDLEQLGGRFDDFKNWGDVRMKEEFNENFFIEENGITLLCPGKPTFGNKADGDWPQSFFVVAFIESTV
jgi:hypothetical protein